jgi:hypothetical protein
MSDSLKGTVPEFEDAEVGEQSKNFIIAILEIVINKSKTEPLMGSLVGIELGDNVKIDFKMLLSDAFSTIGLFNQGKIDINSIQLHLLNDVMYIDGPFKITSMKLIDIDQTLQLCVLAIDLTR